LAIALHDLVGFPIIYTKVLYNFISGKFPV
jgi:hypothetical protein